LLAADVSTSTPCCYFTVAGAAATLLLSSFTALALGGACEAALVRFRQQHTPMLLQAHLRRSHAAVAAALAAHEDGDAGPDAEIAGSADSISFAFELSKFASIQQQVGALEKATAEPANRSKNLNSNVSAHS
jgi:hypothetical protein